MKLVILKSISLSVVDMCCRHNEQSWELELHSKNYYDNLKLF